LEVRNVFRGGGVIHLQKNPTTVCSEEADEQWLTSGKSRQWQLVPAALSPCSCVYWTRLEITWYSAGKFRNEL